MRFHCLGIPHTWTSKELLACAFTQKVLNFCEMMTRLGHSVFHYGNEMSEVVCTEHVSVTTRAHMEKTYRGKRGGIYYWKHQQFEHSMDSYIGKKFVENTIAALRSRVQPDDFVLAFWGTGHKEICDAVADMGCHIVEPGIGYPTTFAPYRVFESYAKLHLVKGQWDQAGIEPYTTPNWTDEVIPNYFNPEDFEYSEVKEDYLLFIGRIINTKGVEIAMRLADHAGLRLLVAGQGDFVSEMGWEPYDCVEIVGTVGVEDRKRLMSRAVAGVCASWYIEPFCGTHIEFGFSGTPVLTTDWGVFTETVQQGRNGYRCRSFDEFAWAIDNIDTIEPSVCRDMAMNYSMDRVALMYHEYFERLLFNAHADNFWSLPDDRRHLDMRRRDLSVKDVESQREGLVPRTIEGGEYHPGGSVKGGDAWLMEGRVWKYCLDKLGVESVLDIGAGEGHAAQWFFEHGCSVVAVDNDEGAMESAVYPIVHHDFRESSCGGSEVDLIYMAEFVEHLSVQHLPHLAHTLNRSDLVLMTYAPPGHEGIGHINCQEQAYWVDWMDKCGFKLCEDGTQAIREVAEHPHFKERGLLFRRAV